MLITMESYKMETNKQLLVGLCSYGLSYISIAQMVNIDTSKLRSIYNGNDKAISKDESARLYKLYSFCLNFAKSNGIYFPKDYAKEKKLNVIKTLAFDILGAFCFVGVFISALCLFRALG